MSTKTTIAEYGGYSLCTVQITGKVNSQSNVILAAYKDGKIVKTEIRPYSKTEETFALTEDFDTVKVMVWENMRPVTAVEAIKK